VIKIPYIEGDYDRGTYLPPAIPRTPGELNFSITMLMNAYLLEKGLSYANIAETLGAAHEAEQEFRRRVLVPYEDKKLLENGDVYYKRLLS